MTTDRIELNESEIAVQLGEHVQDYLEGDEELFRAKVAELQARGVPSGAISHALKKYYSLSISKVALQRMVAA